MKARSNGTGERRVTRAKRLERRRGHDRDALIGDARLAPPAAREVGRSVSGSIVTIVPSAGWPSAIHSVE
jgi:hypothetical protein